MGVLWEAHLEEALQDRPTDGFLVSVGQLPLLHQNPVSVEEIMVGPPTRKPGHWSHNILTNASVKLAFSQHLGILQGDPYSMMPSENCGMWLETDYRGSAEGKGRFGDTSGRTDQSLWTCPLRCWC